MLCRNCDSSNLKYEKWIHYGRKQGKTFHYKVICLNCGKRYHVKRSKRIYEKVKWENWRYKNDFKETI